jgi:hypothetical protein
VYEGECPPLAQGTYRVRVGYHGGVDVSDVFIVAGS